MKTGWQFSRLSEVCQLISGRHIDAKDYNTESRGLGYLTGPSDFGAVNPVITKWTEHPIIKAKNGDILITVKGSGVGKINLLHLDDVAISRQLMAIRVTGAEPRFVHSFLSSTFEHFQSLSTGAAIPGISREQILGIQIPLPPLPEQRRIVGILDEAFDGIATAKANAEKNLQNARDLFESHLQAVFTQRGEGWTDHNQLEDLTDPESPITYGVVKPGDEGDVAFVRGGDLSRGRVLIDQLRTITHEVSQQYRRTLLRGGELLISLVGQPGQVAVAPEQLAGANIARQVGLIRLRASVHAEFVRYFLFSPIGQSALGARQSGSVQQVINLGELRQVKIPLPPTDTQARVVKNLDSVSGEIERLESLYRQKLAALDALKKSLLHQAFSGQL